MRIDADITDTFKEETDENDEDFKKTTDTLNRCIQKSFK